MKTVIKVIVWGFVALLLFGACSVMVGDAMQDTGTTNAGISAEQNDVIGESEAEAAPDPVETTADKDTIGDGTWEVGVDIRPGRYKTAGPDPEAFGGSCYWERNKSLDAGFEGILQNDNITGPTTIRIRKTDGVFKTSGCSAWVRQ